MTCSKSDSPACRPAGLIRYGWTSVLAGVSLMLAAPGVAQTTEVTVDDAAVTVEGPGTYALPFTVQRSGNLEDSLRLSVETVPGGPSPAEPGVDFTPLPPGTEIVLEPLQDSARVDVTVFGDALEPGAQRTLLLNVIEAQSFNADPRLTPAAIHSQVCCLPRELALADLTGNGHLDVITGNEFSLDIWVLLNDGQGGLVKADDYRIHDWNLGAVKVAAGDVTGNGHADIVAAGFRPHDILVFPGDGTGQLNTPFTLSTGNGQHPWAIELVDIDGDGHLDIVTVNAFTADISVLMNNGDGSFAAALNFPIGGQFPTGLVLADVNGDGHLDVVTSNPESLTVSVLTGDSTGQFSAPQVLSVGSENQPQSVAVGDVTGDGHPDIVTANQPGFGGFGLGGGDPGSVSILAGDGSGGFADAIELMLDDDTGRAQDVALADMTGNGVADIIVTQTTNNTVAFFAATGDGGFADVVNIPTGSGPNGLAIADMTGDGHLDVVTVDGTGETVSILPGDGAGNIGFLDRHHDVGQYPHWIELADLNGNGHLDAVTVNIQSDDVSVLIGDGQGGFAPAVHHPVGGSPIWVAVADVNGDGIPDVLTANLFGGTVSVLIGDGSGGFAPVQDFSVGDMPHTPRSLAVGDVNGNGHMDIVTINERPFSPFDDDAGTVMLRNAVEAPERDQSAGPDLSNYTASILLSDGAGGFADALIVDLGPEINGANGVALSDLTGNGHLDILTTNLGGANLALLEGDGTGGFAAPVYLSTDIGPVVVLVADVTGSGHDDIISLNHTGQSVSVLAGNGDGTFAPAQHFPIYLPPSGIDCTVLGSSWYCPWPWGMALGDVTGNGHLDIVTADTDNSTATVLANDGRGNFVATVFDTGSHPGSVAIGDLTGNGNLDVITANRQNNNVSVLSNRLSTAVITRDQALGTVTHSGGGPAPVLDIEPQVLDFGTHEVGAFVGPESVTLTNTGGGLLEVSSVSTPFGAILSAGGSCGSTPFSLAAGESCMLDYVFNPLSEGMFSFTVDLQSSAGPGSFELRGEADDGGGGTDPAPEVSLPGGPSVTFGVVEPGAAASAEIVLLNSGDDMLEVSRIQGPAAPFSWTDGAPGHADCGATPFNLMPGAQCAWTVHFQPAAEGDYSDVFQIVSNADSSPDTVTLSGTAAGGGTAPVATAIPTLGDLGRIALVLLMMMVAGITVQTRLQAR